MSTFQNLKKESKSCFMELLCYSCVLCSVLYFLLPYLLLSHGDDPALNSSGLLYISVKILSHHPYIILRSPAYFLLIRQMFSCLLLLFHSLLYLENLCRIYKIIKYINTHYYSTDSLVINARIITNIKKHITLNANDINAIVKSWHGL